MKRLTRQLISLFVVGMFLVAQLPMVAAQGTGTPSSQEAANGQQPPVIVETDAQADTAGFTVSWQTMLPTAGWVEYGAAPDHLETVAYDARGPGVVDIQHRVRVESLTPGTLYYYAVVSRQGETPPVRAFFKITTSGEKLEAIAPGQDTVSTTEPAQVEMDRQPTRPVKVARPMGVTVAESSDSGFTVTWETPRPETGWVEYGLSWDQMTGVAYDERGQDVSDTQHRAVINGLQPGTIVYYVLVSDGRRFDNGNSVFKFAIGGERFEAETASRRADAAQLPDVQAEPIEPARPTGVREIEADETQFVIEWQTAEPQTGWIEYGSSWEQM